MADSSWIACESVTAAADSSTLSPGQAGEQRQDTGASADIQHDISGLYRMQDRSHVAARAFLIYKHGLVVIEDIKVSAVVQSCLLLGLGALPEFAGCDHQDHQTE